MNPNDRLIALEKMRAEQDEALENFQDCLTALGSLPIDVDPQLLRDLDAACSVASEPSTIVQPLRGIRA
jgi:hypothetical protein